MNIEEHQTGDLEEEEENLDEENSPLRQDFGDFGMMPFTDTPKSKINYLDYNSSKAPLKAVFDDFDGVSAGSLASRESTLDLPFAEEGLNSIKVSPSYTSTKSSKGNISQVSSGLSSVSGKQMSKPVNRSRSSPQSTGNSGFLDTPTDFPDYANRVSEAFMMTEVGNNSPHQNFLPIDDCETLTIVSSSPERISTNETDLKQKTIDFTTSNKTTEQKPPTLNNGYVGSTTS